MPGEARQVGEQVARQRDEEALDVGLFLGAVRPAELVLDLEVGEHPRHMPLDIVPAPVDLHRERHAPGHEAAPQQRRDRQAPADRHDQNHAPARPDLEGADDRVAPQHPGEGIGAHQVGGGRIQFPQRGRREGISVARAEGGHPPGAVRVEPRGR